MRAVKTEKPKIHKDYKYGDVIRKRRLELGLTQRQVADQCGITDSAFAHIEREMRLPSELVAGRIAKALGLTRKIQAEFDAGLQRVRIARPGNACVTAIPSSRSGGRGIHSRYPIPTSWPATSRMTPTCSKATFTSKRPWQNVDSARLCSVPSGPGLLIHSK